MQIDQLLRSYSIVNNAPLLRFYAIQANSLASDGSIIPTTFQGSGGVVIPTYGANITIDLSLGNFFSIIASTGAAFTILAPTNAPVGVAIGRRLTIQIKNASGGAAGVATFTGGAGGFHLAGAWVQAANGNGRSATFAWDGVNYAEVSRNAADVPN
jgi:hypothetical protein